MIVLEEIKRNNPALLADMALHYSQPKGFVGRNICYAVYCGQHRYGHIVGGSAVKYLPGRNEFFGFDVSILDCHIINNIFFRVSKIDGAYPLRNFTTQVLAKFRQLIRRRWFEKYGDKVLGFESLIELPRTGECYRRDGWTIIGQTQGFTCKREAGYGTDDWGGKRVWDTTNLRPKLVFARKV